MSKVPQIVVVTGAASGMGAAHVKKVAALGAHVCAVDIVDGSALVSGIVGEGGSASFHQLDVKDQAGWTDLIDEIRQEHGRLDGLVNNAGLARPGGIMDTTEEDWRLVMDVNLTSVLFAMRAAAPLMRDSGGGSIVNISSIVGLTGYRTAGYSSSKWALRGLTRTAASEFAPWNVRANTVLPGLIETPIIAHNPQQFIDSTIASTPAARVGRPEEVSAAVAFLLSTESSFMTGAEVVVDGGLSSNGLYWRIVNEANAET